jgi:peptidyl-prolyl cis-trans isomerase C
MGHHHDEAEDEQVPFRLEGAAGTGHHVLITRAKRHWLDEHLERQWRRPPTVAESDRFVADYVREEILYREALALGLDHDDLVVRRRLVQKMEMLALRDAAAVSESDLMDHYLDHRADYALPESISFRHIFYSTAVRGADAQAAATAALGEMRDAGASRAVDAGDPPPVPREVTDWTRSAVDARFGAGFAAVVFELEPGAWTGPLASAYGRHLVQVGRRSPARVPDYGEVADRVAMELDTERRAGALERIYAAVRDTYEVQIEPTAEESSPRSSHPHSHDGTDRHEERTPA